VRHTSLVRVGDTMAADVLIWGMVAGSALFAGALIAWFERLPRHLVPLLMAFGGGLLISVAAFELLDEALKTAGLLPVAAGYATGALLFAIGLLGLDRAGARHRKRSAHAIGTPAAAGVVALATALDTVPESLIIGLNFSHGAGLGLATVIAVLLSNIPEGLTSTVRMKAERRSAHYVFGLWAAVAVTAGVFSLIGYEVYDDLAPEWVGFTQALAGGALLVYVADHMIPEAFAETRETAGLVTAMGFLLGFALAEGLG
jgi:ZIP family zinc transporter